MNGVQGETPIFVNFCQAKKQMSSSGLVFDPTVLTLSAAGGVSSHQLANSGETRLAFKVCRDVFSQRHDEEDHKIHFQKFIFLK